MNRLLALTITLTTFAACGADNDLVGFGLAGKGEVMSHQGEPISFVKTLSIRKWEDGYLSLIEGDSTPLKDDGETPKSFAFEVMELKCNSGTECTGPAHVNLQATVEGHTVEGHTIHWGINGRSERGRTDAFRQINVNGKTHLVLNISPAYSDIGPHRDITLTFSGSWRDEGEVVRGTVDHPAQNPAQNTSAQDASATTVELGGECDPNQKNSCGNQFTYCKPCKAWEDFCKSDGVGYCTACHDGEKPCEHLDKTVPRPTFSNGPPLCKLTDPCSDGGCCSGSSCIVDGGGYSWFTDYDCVNGDWVPVGEE